MTVSLFTQRGLAPAQAEVCRYLGCRGATPDAQTLALIDRASAPLSGGSYRVCYTVLPLRKEGDAVDLGGCLTLRSASLARHLQGCDRAVLFCATLGADFDRRLLAARLRPALAVVQDAVGTAAIEQLCDRFCAQLPQPQRPRFSPGYGDLPLETQRPLLALLDAARLLGVGLTDALLMTPTKSVTALVGLLPNTNKPKQ